MRALVLGADGFVGTHLVDHLRGSGDSVVEAVGPGASAVPGRTPVDVRDSAAVRALVRDCRPEAIYHLAAVAYGPDAAADLDFAVDVTVRGTAVLLEAAADVGSASMVLVTGSSEVYGAPALERIHETTRLRPVNLYGATKAAQEVIALTFGRARGLPVVVTRAFNHIGRGQRDSFVIPSFARQLRLVQRGEAPPMIRVGNLSPIRDFSDVRDVVRAYRLLVAGGHSGDAVNVASGTGVSVQQMLDALVAISHVSVSIEVDPGRVRSNDPPRLVGDATRLHERTGWSAAFTIEQALAEVWADAQERW